MSNENKIRILYVQPGKYPEEQFIANELHPLQRLVGGYMQAVWKKSKSAFCPTSFGLPGFFFLLVLFSGKAYCMPITMTTPLITP